jgi:putative oxidoreductase
MLNAIHIIGQIIFGGYFIWQGINHFVNLRDYTAFAAAHKVPMPNAAVIVTGIILILGGLGVLFNIFTTIALVLLVIFLLPVTFIMHAFWKAENPGEKASQKIQFFKNLALLGAVLLLF